jgi:hypothetical protein
VPHPTSIDPPSRARPVGYAALVERHALAVLPHHRWSFVADQGIARELGDGRVVFRPGFANPAEMDVIDHLLFALRYDGTNLEISSALFAALDAADFEQQLARRIAKRPTGKYLRRLWFLYEWLTEREVPVPDAVQGNYVPFLDPEQYVIAAPGRASRRHRIHDNLLGNRKFCPLVRRTELLARTNAAALRDALDQLVGKYDPGVFARAISYLYTKETLSSFAIERESPSSTKAEKFALLLKRIDSLDPWSERELAAIQSRIVDERFAESCFRDAQNYVGESIDLTRQHIHFVPPRPEDVRDLMEGLIAAARSADATRIDPVSWAASLSFGFVFIHPFLDGNGRLHRFLIHQVLAKGGVTPPGIVAPISAVMLSRLREYDAVLEAFSKPLLELVDYELLPDMRLEVKNQTALHYRYVDYTTMAEALVRWLEDAIRIELPTELDFVVGFRRTREAMDRVVALPDRLAELFVKFCLQNGGSLSAAKRESHLHMLSDDEIAGLERCVRDNMPARLVSRA